MASERKSKLDGEFFWFFLLKLCLQWQQKCPVFAISKLPWKSYCWSLVSYLSLLWSLNIRTSARSYIGTLNSCRHPLQKAANLAKNSLLLKLCWITTEAFIFINFESKKRPKMSVFSKHKDVLTFLHRLHKYLKELVKNQKLAMKSTDFCRGAGLEKYLFVFGTTNQRKGRCHQNVSFVYVLHPTKCCEDSTASSVLSR